MYSLTPNDACTFLLFTPQVFPVHSDFRKKFSVNIKKKIRKIGGEKNGRKK